MITDAGHCLCAELKDEAAAVRQQLLASVELEKLAHLTELLEQLQRMFLPLQDDDIVVGDRCHRGI